ncbi:MAG: chemotaxis protein CheD [Acidobacteria bacterium]|nr:chemotaxis protein CheD [Acidobacteriota bacterium]MBI3487128.1 chemotaxis protein CheD [Acidobacteriota bacterium]
MLSEQAPRIITLKPGEFAFAEGLSRIQTLLGSCVSVTFWDAGRRLGAMCHYMLPERPSAKRGDTHLGRYGLEVMAHILETFRNRGIATPRLETRMFGGGNMFDPSLQMDDAISIGPRNVQAGRQFLRDQGLRLCQEDTAGEVSRRVTFEVSTGAVMVEHGASLPVEPRRKR